MYDASKENFCMFVLQITHQIHFESKQQSCHCNACIIKIVFCFIFVSAYTALYKVSLDHNIDCLMLYSVQLETMYSRLNSSLKLSDIVHDLSCQP